MKALILFIAFVLFIPLIGVSQEFDPEKTYIITKNDGTRFVGQILSSDAREVLIQTTTRGQLVIPKHEIRTIVEFQPGDEKYKEIFASRYFISTNGLPIEKGDSYIQWTLVGPDIQFGVSENIGIGVMTTWVATPLSFSIKKTGSLGNGLHYGLGALAGGDIWGGVGGFKFALPFAAVTMGGQNANLNVAVGYGFASFGGYSGSQSLFSFGAMKKITRNGSFVFDSFIFPVDNESFAILIPGFRIQTQEKSAFQFGFPGIIYSGSSTPLGFPIASWFRKF